MNSVHSGTLAGIGSFRCQACDYAVTLAAEDALPQCPGCGGQEFVRASLLRSQGFAGDHPREADRHRPGWLDEVVEELAREPGEYLAYDAADRVVTVPLTREWTRIGRSLAADLRFDDPTVSRRHALIVRQADGVRVLDDRSLNGVFVNGERVDLRVLEDGDSITISSASANVLHSTRSPLTNTPFRLRSSSTRSPSG